MTKEDILQLSNLSRVKMSDEEVTKFQTEIESILEYVGAVDRIVSDLELEKVPGVVKNVMREDVVVEKSKEDREALVSSFPEKVGDYLKVKKILNPDS
ncbi:Asp-tRNA(Asn)/Glu-tRNA(Gln) amidotransferase GatCAB subunit C [Candidatus Kaiserbacteria bacterium CG10_big_fil_rev_8_21_14_0_10_44_10]|uniref:Asp-tRNA(Asn)/Glu-tRNA(Gln) amidotransferase GatCAB subunit C n=1 Tax=Candidatus Kaiserbacteria bacterium CG10_big_fil_rev_8_21_14_0_10_44_10 TaxID=1974606 RepID=A0A2H0UIP9_9BACT|nr:MAG: Asp-tRNA(Asn)/Glu-tRNA(Gln) amidotransferase GatCAB subunit C [Candidatus Kaiserbacteria bacterium CG10_big_fil_rev_8_21_14_0_10_44_10]